MRRVARRRVTSRPRSARQDRLRTLRHRRRPDRLVEAYPGLAPADALKIVTSAPSETACLPRSAARARSPKKSRRLLADNIDLAVPSLKDMESCWRSGAVREAEAIARITPPFPLCGRPQRTTNSAYRPAICNPLYNSSRVAAKRGLGLGKVLANQSRISASFRFSNFSRYSLRAA